MGQIMQLLEKLIQLLEKLLSLLQQMGGGQQAGDKSGGSSAGKSGEGSSAGKASGGEGASKGADSSDKSGSTGGEKADSTKKADKSGAAEKADSTKEADKSGAAENGGKSDEAGGNELGDILKKLQGLLESIKAMLSGQGDSAGKASGRDMDVAESAKSGGGHGADCSAEEVTAEMSEMKESIAKNDDAVSSSDVAEG
jgi:hypothetical protein